MRTFRQSCTILHTKVEQYASGRSRSDRLILEELEIPWHCGADSLRNIVRRIKSEPPSGFRNVRQRMSNIPCAEFGEPRLMRIVDLIFGKRIPEQSKEFD